MMRSKGIVVFVLFLTLFVWPVFEIFDTEVFVLGVPLPIVYLFTVWGLSAVVAYRGGK
ncbi:MAG: hypothetical protein M1395_00955 [Bacteroidetes bacterium]|jgi:hypothetical protein|nr:hypothetical protein [Bacteroidota bacterium]